MTRAGEILVVDDDPDYRHVLRVMLEKNGYVVRTAKDGREALAALEAKMPDLMILDIMMATDTEGFDVASVLRDDLRFADLPIIMVTCFLEKVRAEGPDKFQHILGEEWPADWLFEKPVDTQKLLDKIKGVLGGG